MNIDEVVVQQKTNCVVELLFCWILAQKFWDDSEMVISWINGHSWLKLTMGMIDILAASLEVTQEPKLLTQLLLSIAISKP